MIKEWVGETEFLLGILAGALWVMGMLTNPNSKVSTLCIVLITALAYCYMDTRASSSGRGFICYIAAFAIGAATIYVGSRAWFLDAAYGFITALILCRLIWQEGLARLIAPKRIPENANLLEKVCGWALYVSDAGRKRQLAALAIIALPPAVVLALFFFAGSMSRAYMITYVAAHLVAAEATLAYGLAIGRTRARHRDCCGARNP